MQNVLYKKIKLINLDSVKLYNVTEFRWIAIFIRTICAILIRTNNQILYIYSYENNLNYLKNNFKYSYIYHTYFRDII